MTRDPRKRKPTTSPGPSATVAALKAKDNYDRRELAIKPSKAIRSELAEANTSPAAATTPDLELSPVNTIMSQMTQMHAQPKRKPKGNINIPKNNRLPSSCTPASNPNPDPNPIAKPNPNPNPNPKLVNTNANATSKPLHALQLIKYDDLMDQATTNYPQYNTNAL